MPQFLISMLPIYCIYMTAVSSWCSERMYCSSTYT